MRHRRKFKIVLFAGSVGLVVVIALLLPMLSRSGVEFPLCTLPAVSAQGNPCLDREVTISAQEVQILQLEGTMNAREIAYLNLEGTDTALRATLSSGQRSPEPENRVVITVPVLMTLVDTATDAPLVSATVAQPNCVVHAVEVIAKEATKTPALLTHPPIEIVCAFSLGDINAEGVDIRNMGSVVDLSGWRLSDTQGNIYTFPQQRLFTGGVVTVYTRSGSDTYSEKFWGRDSALWSSGDTITLTDERGELQSVYSIP